MMHGGGLGDAHSADDGGGECVVEEELDGADGEGEEEGGGYGDGEGLGGCFIVGSIVVGIIFIVVILVLAILARHQRNTRPQQRIVIQFRHCILRRNGHSRTSQDFGPKSTQVGSVHESREGFGGELDKGGDGNGEEFEGEFSFLLVDDCGFFLLLVLLDDGVADVVVVIVGGKASCDETASWKRKCSSISVVGSTLS